MNSNELFEMGCDLAREEAEQARLRADAQRYRTAIERAVELLSLYRWAPATDWPRKALDVLNAALGKEAK